MDVIFDNIVYSIQKIGGISCVFYEITKRILEDDRFKVRFVEKRGSYGNFYRLLLNIRPQKILYEESVISKRIGRFINPKMGIDRHYIFHSSYYRTSRDKSAINITTVHDFVYERYGLQGWKGKLHIWQQKRAVMNSDVIICISENTKKDLLHFYKGVDSDKVHVVYNGVSDDYYQIKDKSNFEFPFDEGSYGVFVGGRLSYKNFNLSVSACAVANMKLVIIGAPLNDKEKAFVDSTLGCDNYVCMSGVSNNKLNEIYNGAYCLFYPSSYEGFGIPCIEAQKAGCPVIAYNASSIPEVMAVPEMMINTLSVDDMMVIIHRLKENPYREKVVAKGIEFARQFSWDRCYDELTKIYEMAYKNRMEK